MCAVILNKPQINGEIKYRRPFADGTREMISFDSTLQRFNSPLDEFAVADASTIHAAKAIDRSRREWS
jgi:hypothetical protein